MAEEETFLSLKDFVERGIKIDPNWTGLEALAVVAGLASDKLEEEKMRKEKKEKERKSVQCNGQCGCWLPRYNGFEYGSSSVSCNDSQTRIDVDFDKPVSAPAINDKWICLARFSDRREREKVLKKPLTNSVSEKKLGYQKVAAREKLLGDAMKARILSWEDDEWSAGYEKQKQKLKRNVNGRDNSEEKDSESNKKIKRTFRYIVPEVPPALPQEFKEKIENVKGSNINLVIQKSLYSSDLSDHQSRLLIPWKQIVSMEKFLNDEERIHLDKENSKIEVKFIEPSLEECVMTLKQRKMKKEKGKFSLSYVLITQWKDFKNRNNLEVGDVYQIWSFRIRGGKLCLAFVLVGKGGQIGEENNQNHHGDLDGANTSEGTVTGSNEGTGSIYTQAPTPTP